MSFRYRLLLSASITLVGYIFLGVMELPDRPVLAILILGYNLLPLIVGGVTLFLPSILSRKH